jgi:hypothetical protein
MSITKSLFSVPYILGILVLGDPDDGCSPFRNADEINGKVVFLDEGK